MTKKDWLETSCWLIVGAIIGAIIGSFILLGIKSFKQSRNVYISDSVAVDSTTVDTVSVKTEKIDSSYWNSRKKVREAIEENKNPRICAMSNKNGTVLIMGGNGWICTSNVNNDMRKKLHEINQCGKTVIDVTITDGDYWVIVYDKNNYYGVLPQNLKDRLHSFNSNVEYKTITFNEEGEYIVLTTNGFYTSSSKYKRFYESRKIMLGELRTATIWKKGAIFCFEKGITFCGTIPESIAKKMDLVDSGMKDVMKFTDKGDFWFYRAANKEMGYACAWCSHINDVDNKKSVKMVTNDFTEEQSEENRISKSSSQGGNVRTPTPVQRPQTCGICGGSGRCSECGGSGVSYFGHGHICGACGGYGKCATCGGRGISGYVLEYVY